MIETIEVSDDITYPEINNLLHNIKGNAIHLSNYERIENGYLLNFTSAREESMVNIDDFLYLYERADQLMINFSINIDLHQFYSDSLDYIEVYFPEIRRYIEEEGIEQARFNIYDNYDVIRQERIEERLNIHKKYFNSFKEKIENGDLSALVIASLIHKFHNSEDLESCYLNIDLHSINAGVLKYLENPITLEQLFDSKCYNNYEYEDRYLVINHDNINFIKRNYILSCNNPSIYMNRPEIKFLNCLSKYFNKLEISR